MPNARPELTPANTRFTVWKRKRISGSEHRTPWQQHGSTFESQDEVMDVVNDLTSKGWECYYQQSDA